MANTAEDEHIAFHKLLHEQIGRDFTAAQQYTAIAIYFDSNHLPQLALEAYVARELNNPGQPDPTAPKAAGAVV